MFNVFYRCLLHRRQKTSICGKGFKVIIYYHLQMMRFDALWETTLVGFILLVVYAELIILNPSTFCLRNVYNCNEQTFNKHWIHTSTINITTVNTNNNICSYLHAHFKCKAIVWHNLCITLVTFILMFTKCKST